MSKSIDQIGLARRGTGEVRPDGYVKYVRVFAGSWPDFPIRQQAVGELPWGHNLMLLAKLKDQEQRLTYAQAALEHGWSRNVLVHHIELRTVERKGQAITNFESQLPKPQSDLARESLKDPYRFDFLGIGDEASERELEAALVQHVTRFLLELGAGFAFVGRQVHLDVGGDDFFIDLLFYHLKLRCYVVIEIKGGKFKPEHTGQLSFYLTAVDAQVKAPEDGPTIGLLLCKSKNKIVAEYALRDTNSPMGVAEYQLLESLPKDLEANLPSIEQIERELGEVGDERRELEGLEGRGVPMTWKTVPLEELAEVLDCKHRTPHYADNGFPVVRPRDVKEEGIDLEQCAKTSQAEYDDLIEKRCPQIGDIVYSRNATYGVAAHVQTDAPFAIGQDVCLIVPTAVDSRYLWRTLNSSPIKTQLEPLVSGTTFKRINLASIRKLAVPLPPLPEQKRIAAILDKADAIKRKRQEAIRITEELLRAAFLEMFGDPVTNPKGWASQKVGELLLETRSGATVRPGDFRSTGFPLIHKGAIKPAGEILLDATSKNTFVDERFAKDKEESVVDRNFVVITLRDLVPTGPSIGLASSLEFATHPKYLLVERVYGVVLDRKRMLPDYFVWLSNDRRFRWILSNMAVGATQVHIRRSDYNELAIPVPPIEHQRRFAECVASVRAITLRMTTSLAEADKLFVTLANRAFTGRQGA